MGILLCRKGARQQGLRPRRAPHRISGVVADGSAEYRRCSARRVTRCRQLWLSMLVGVVLLVAADGQAAAAATGLDPELEYNVTFEISEKEAKTLTAVHVLDTMEIGGRMFLVVILPGYRTRGFINIDSIRSILPTKQGLATGY